MFTLPLERIARGVPNAPCQPETLVNYGYPCHFIGMAIDKDDPFTGGTERAITRRKTAIALKDNTETDPAALAEIIAAGRGSLAEKIVQLAFENNIPVREDSDLAELLAQFELDTPIPTEAVMAVAEILSYVYKLNQRAEPLTGVYGGGLPE